MVTRPLAVGVVLGVVVVGGWLAQGRLWPGESAGVRTAVETLAATVTNAAGASQGPGQLAVLADLRNQLTEDVTLEVSQPALVIDGRDQVLELAARQASSPTRLVLSFVDVTVTLTGDETVATVGATVQVTETTAAGNESFDAQQVEMVWVRQGRSWLLRSARTIDVLR